MLHRPCTVTRGHKVLEEYFGVGNVYDELGLARSVPSEITLLPKAPFDPDLEFEEHAPGNAEMGSLPDVSDDMEV